jgi:hypothetical protein
MIYFFFPFHFFLQLGFEVNKECMMQEQGALGIVQRKDLKNNIAFSIQGWTQGDRLFRSPELSNQHMSFSWPLGPHVLWRPFLHNV